MHGWFLMTGMGGRVADWQSFKLQRTGFNFI